MKVEEGDDGGEASKELNDLYDGDEDLARNVTAVEDGGVISVHEGVNEAVEDHAIHAEDEAGIKPAPNFEGDGGVMPDVQQSERLAARNDDRGVQELVNLGEQKEVEGAL